jgi:hypothetical protein
MTWRFPLPMTRRGCMLTGYVNSLLFALKGWRAAPIKLLLQALIYMFGATTRLPVTYNAPLWMPQGHQCAKHLGTGRTRFMAGLWRKLSGRHAIANEAAGTDSKPLSAGRNQSAIAQDGRLPVVIFSHG